MTSLPCKGGLSPSSPLHIKSSVASMYQKAGQKTIAQMAIRQKKNVLGNRQEWNWYGARDPLTRPEELEQLAIRFDYLNVTWEEMLARERGQISNFCRKESKLRASWTIIGSEKVHEWKKDLQHVESTHEPRDNASMGLGLEDGDTEPGSITGYEPS